MRRTFAVMLVLVQCGENYELKNECRKTFEALCKHQMACQRTNDIAQCEIDMQQTQVCDFSHTVADFQLCQANVGASDCNVQEPCVCYAVLCDAYSGCGPASQAGTCDTSGSGTAYYR